MSSFNAANRVGDRGVALVRARFPDWKPPPPSEKRWDLETVYNNGATMEVKTDTYPHTETPNFYMEHHTYVAPTSKTLRRTLMGGPWRAARDSVDVFTYVFLEPTPLIFVFADVPKLVARLEERRSTYDHRIAGSGRYTAMGYLVPRDDLKYLYGSYVVEP